MTNHPDTRIPPPTVNRRHASLKAGRLRRNAEPVWDQFDAEFEATRAEMAQSGRTLSRGLFFLFLGIAVLMLAIALLTGSATARRVAAERPALAQVTALTERKNSEGNAFYYPVVSFDTPDGERAQVQLSEGSWPPSQRVGDLVTVLYDPARPLDARVQSGGGTFMLYTWTLVTGVLCISFAVAAAIAGFLSRQPI